MDGWIVPDFKAERQWTVLLGKAGTNSGSSYISSNEKREEIQLNDHPYLEPLLKYLL